MHHKHMRTTLSISDDVMAELKVFADARGENLSTAATELMRRGLRPHVLQLKQENGLTILAAPPGSETISREHVQRLMDEDPW